jgi:methyl-accepting chemotaxis protein
MEKAEFGAGIARGTAESLSEIVTGINRSSEIIGEIASASKAQSTGIEQINIGIGQVAQIVQQNSATAEESAAAAEQLSSQSSALEGLISQFTLKDGNKGRRALPPKRYK